MELLKSILTLTRNKMTGKPCERSPNLLARRFRLPDGVGGSGIGEVRGRVSAERRRWFGSGSAGVPEMWGLVPWETLGDLGSMADRRLVLWIPQIYLIS